MDARFVCTLCCLSLSVSFALHAETQGERYKSAEILIDESLLQEFAFTQRRTKPILSEEGDWVYPDIGVLATAAFGTSPNSALAYLNVGINGVANMSKTQSVGRRGRHSVTANVSTGVQGGYQQELLFNGNALTAGHITGGMTLSPSVSVSNNFRALNGLVNRVAMKKINEMMGSKLPGKIAQADGQAADGIRTAAEQAAMAVAGVLARANEVMPSKLPERVSAGFVTAGGGNGWLKGEFFDDWEGGEKRQAPPRFDLENQAQMRSVVHEDLLNNALTPELSGKEMKLTALKSTLCGPGMAKFLDFCKSDLTEDAKKMSILFDDKKPVELLLRDGKIILRLNAVYRRRKTPPKAEGPLLQKPDNKDIEFETAPYKVEAVYRVQASGAVLEGISVGERENAGARSGGGASGSHALGALPSLRQITNFTLGPVIKKQIEKAFQGVFKPKIEFGSFSFPSKIGTTEGFAPQIAEAGTLVPLEVKAENGWLAVSSTFCSERMLPLGLTFNIFREGENGPVRLQVTEVALHGPAWQQYFKAGEIIDSIGEPGKRPVALVDSAQPFFDFIRERAKGQDAESRTVEIKGRAADGTPFARTLSLCPNTLDHRARAARLFESFTVAR